MNKEELGIILSRLRNGKTVKSLTHYSIISIEDARSNYPVANLMAYCNEAGIAFVIRDIATEDTFPVNSVSELHGILKKLMQRYDIDDKFIYRKTGKHYTPNNPNGSLSITTLLAICETIYAELIFKEKE